MKTKKRDVIYFSVVLLSNEIKSTLSRALNRINVAIICSLSSRWWRLQGERKSSCVTGIGAAAPFTFLRVYIRVWRIEEKRKFSYHIFHLLVSWGEKKYSWWIIQKCLFRIAHNCITANAFCYDYNTISFIVLYFV
jgi:hypothetical protein